MADTSPDIMDEAQLEVLAKRGIVLYNEKLKAALEPEHNGSTVAIHLDSGDYAIAGSSPDAMRALRARRPEGLIMTTLVGPDQMDQLAYRMLGSRSSSTSTHPK